MFKRVYLEISNICNVQCSFCPIVEKDNKLMDVEEFEEVLMQVAPLHGLVNIQPLGVCAIGIHRGVPLALCRVLPHQGQ